MKFEFVAYLIGQSILLLVGSYFLFYKAWVKALGKEIAKLATIEEFTRLQEGVKKAFHNELESYKSKLSEELSMKIEPLKAQMAKDNISHQVQFAYLHQERAKAIIELYQKLTELHSAMVNWTMSMHPIIEDADKEAKDRAIRANKALNEFNNFFLLNKLFLPLELNKYIEDVLTEYWSKGWDYGYMQNQLREGSFSSELLREFSKDMTKISKELKEGLPEKLNEIEKAFRKLLSVQE